MHGLKNVRVVDLSMGIAGAYTSKLFADAGADVIKVEPAEGDALRSWSATNADLEGKDGALFQFLHTSKRSVIGTLDDAAIMELISSADLLIESFPAGVIDELNLCEKFPSLVWLSITAYGRGGPYSNRPATEFTIQADSGSMSSRGLLDRPPLMAGGRISDWVGGTFAAVAAQAAVHRALKTGQGEHIDFSMLECMNIAGSSYGDLMARLVGRPPITAPSRSFEFPSIEPTLDGWVGFNTNSRQQYNDFVVMIGHPELMEDEEMAQIPGRIARMDEWNKYVRDWTTQHSTAEIVELASAFRIPVAPVHNGAGVFDFEHFKERGVFVENPSGGFLQPRQPYLVNSKAPGEFGPVPKLGEHSDRIEAREKVQTRVEPSERALPLKGIRVLDATAWWAGPSATQMFAYLGAEVIHLEAIQRPDGMRMTGGAFVGKAEKWWEYSALYLSANTNKSGLTLDLNQPKGMKLMRELISDCDIFVENYSPRVMDGFKLGWEDVHKLNPTTIMARMPAFGLSGPWRDNVGFAQTMEQITGMAWLTGHEEDQPRIQRGPCDPLSGMHSAFACLVALADREKTGKGCLLECTMVEAALNGAAEQIIEFSAYGNTMEREGNKGPSAAPQNLYACHTPEDTMEHWLALAVENDSQWKAFKQVMGNPEWADNTQLDSHLGRRALHSLLDEKISAFTAGKDLDELVELLVAAGVPAVRMELNVRTSEHPQHIARNFFQELNHPVVGKQPLVTAPFHFASLEQAGHKWLHSPAPTIGQHNREILSRILGLSDAEITTLEAEEVIGTRPKGY